ncbi:MAG: AAA family ATPase [Synergistota bacterium]|uniref:SMC domain protein n=1 Tax=Dethiosulfovibrio peptidovorans DSM 11002 TaxID=469381 RepID=D2Z631_9BACT|nr:AAA family ATPase [Dethiosulfovibrio peptidovorans]EFC90928.1 SMC domain protein [Dethiosulfovibrio peptidovorans DSM 11002]MEA3285730.1 AAA family ATPase [Synergistota bacterium]
MLINLTLNNFRRYEKAHFCFHPKMTILVGENGKGKTTILDAIAVMLGTYFQGSKIKTGQSTVKKDDARLLSVELGGQFNLEPQDDVFIQARSTIRNETIDWIREMGDRGGKAKDIVSIGTQDRKKAVKGEPIDLPLYLYYGSGRLWDIHRNVKTGKPGSRLDAYRFCLDPKSDQKAFEEWFKKLTLAELQKKNSFKGLQTVRNTVLRCIPNSSDFYHDVERDELIIVTDEGPMPFDHLSDGYRNMVAMVADIAHRASRLNPHLEEKAATRTKGIVLIDEIDLHLHPKWQRRVVSDLQEAFPEIQFIATTHSPFIIQSLEPGQVIDLEATEEKAERTCDTGEQASPGTTAPYSNRSIEDIVEDIMGVDIPQRSERYQKMYDVAKEYYKTLREARDADETRKKELKEKLDRLAAPFSENVAYYAFLEAERIAAGVTSEEEKREDKKCDR